MVLLGHVWSVAWRIFEFVVAWAVLESIRDPKIAGIIAVLGLLYATIRTIGIGLSQYFISLSLSLDREFKDIKQKMGHEVEPQSEDERLLIRKANVKHWINLVSMFAIYVLCLYYALARLGSA
jgi:hypothetical protein